ncbi:hypothetical protein Angca_000574, partial [Angiostrongylus cantonensis]
PGEAIIWFIGVYNRIESPSWPKNIEQRRCSFYRMVVDVLNVTIADTQNFCVVVN